jgi:hypothetical protein
VKLKNWWRSPLWVLQLVTGAKSFADNPILGSASLNRCGLHVARLRTAHALARQRRARLAHLLPSELREQFDRDGFVVIRDYLPSAEFRALQDNILHSELPSRVHQQGDTITRRVTVGPALLRQFPQLRTLLESPLWKGLIAYVASSRSKPLYYIQTILGGAVEGPADPQLELHADTFHPSLKAWLFLTDVPEDGRPLTYVAGSHRLSPQRIAWEHRKSSTVLTEGDHLSQRGSFRISSEELAELGLPQPTTFAVPANTLVVVDTCGFHARGDSDRPTTRVELWAYCRPSPFRFFTGGDPLSWTPIAVRRGDWLNRLHDWLDRRGWKKLHWTPVGLLRPIEPYFSHVAAEALGPIQESCPPSSQAA